jgi:hypothetical protein
LTGVTQRVNGTINLTIGVTNFSGAQWLDLDFENTAAGGTLAGKGNDRWQAGPIGDIRLTTRVRLTNIFFFFSANGVPVNSPNGGVPDDIKPGPNPVPNSGPPSVFFFTKFKPSEARGTLNLGSGVSSGAKTYATFLDLLKIYPAVNGLHIFFLAVPLGGGSGGKPTA